MGIKERLIQAHAHAEASPMPTTLNLWRDGIAVEMWDGGRRIERRVTWRDIEVAHINPVMITIDECATALTDAGRALATETTTQT